MYTIDLFESESAPTREKIGAEAVVSRGFTHRQAPFKQSQAISMI